VTRIIAGKAGGRRIAVPAGSGTRPTSDRVREALFASLTSELGGFDGLAVLDLYAGSGAVGLEALSRGAREVLLVESDRQAVQVIRGNLATLGLAGATVQARAVEQLAAGTSPTAYDVVVADPPYGLAAEALARVLTDLAAHGWLAPDAIVVVERERRGGWAWPDGFEPLRERRYGDTVLYYAAAGGALPAAGS
jgi:16S rRNA (guanine966-N2)-methyltransferase